MMVLNREGVNRIMSRRNPPPFYCTLLVVIATQVDMKTEAKTHDELKYNSITLVLTAYLVYVILGLGSGSNIKYW